MKNKLNTILVAILVILICVLYIFNVLVVNRKSENEISPATEDNRPLLIEGEAVLTATSELSVEPKEAIMWHEYTEEELEEELYDDSLELLAICVEAEAGNQDFLGKCLVVDVILNRVDSPDFPDDITSVISQPYQFTSYNDGNMDKVWEPSEETFEAVRHELQNRTDCKILYFTEGDYNPYCTPGYKHGAHYFGY